MEGERERGRRYHEGGEEEYRREDEKGDGKELGEGKGKGMK